MKKLIPLIVFLLILGVGAYLVLRKQASSDAEATRLLPADTPVFLSVPDLQATADRWEGTALARIWADPQIRAFLDKPVAEFMATEAMRELVRVLATVQPQSAFVALTAMDGNQPLLVGGFQHRSDKEQIDAAIASAKSRVRERYPAGKADIERYEGDEIESYAAGEFHLAQVVVGEWFLIANNQALLKQTLDRLHGRDKTPTLAASEIYRKLLGKLPSTVETLAIVQPQVFSQRITTLLESAGNIDPESRRILSQVEGIAASTSIEGADLRDTIYVLGPEIADTSELTMPVLSLTTPDTLLLMASKMRWNLPDPSTDTTGTLQMLQGFFASFAAQGLDLQALAQAFGSEFGLKLDWPAASPRPELLITMEVNDRPTTAKFLQLLAERYGPMANVSHQAKDGTDIYTLSLGGFVPVDPVIALDADRLYIASEGPSLQAVLGSAPATSLASTEAWQESLKKVSAPSESLIYLDMKLLFERAYGTLRPMLVFGAGMMPAVAQKIDVSKLFPTEAFTEHLGPTVFTQSVDGDGVRLESAGPVTVNQLVLLGGFWVGLHNFASMLEK